MRHDKKYIIGRREGGDEGLLQLGRYLALDWSTGSPVYVDALKPHAILICGKRGYGKSYTMGVLMEEMCLLPEEIRRNFSVIVVDTMGVFTESVFPSDATVEAHGNAPEGMPVTIHVPVVHLDKRPEGATPFEIPCSSLSAYDCCELIGAEPLGAYGAALMKAIERLGNFSIEELIEEISRSDTPAAVKSALCPALGMVAGWKLFSKSSSFNHLLKPGSVNVIDLSGFGHDPGVKSCAVAALARGIYDIRVDARRRERGRRESPLVWLLIDEAHMFMDKGRPSRAGDTLVNEWLRQGRQPGLSLVLATQRPSALGTDVLSQADIVICHRLTYRDDVEAMESVRPLYVKEPVREALSRLGTSRGAALVVDDATETYHVIKVRPRKSRHGGGEPDVYRGN